MQSLPAKLVAFSLQVTGEGSKEVAYARSALGECQLHRQATWTKLAATWGPPMPFTTGRTRTR